MLAKLRLECVAQTWVRERRMASSVLFGFCVLFLTLIFIFAIVSRNVDNVIADLAKIPRACRTHAFPDSLCEVSR